MKKCVFMIIISCILFTSTGCHGKDDLVSNVSQKVSQTLEKNNEFNSKVKLFQNEIDKYNSNLQPNKIAAICSSANEKLKDILSMKESISYETKMLLQKDSNFYLKIKDSDKIGNSNCRFIEFGTRQAVMGGGACLYVQLWDDSNLKVQEVNNSVIGENIIKIIDYSIIKQGENYLVYIDKLYGPESTYIRINTKQYTNNEWVSYSDYNESSVNGWKIEKSDYVLLNSNKVSFNNKNDYIVKLNNNILEVNVIDASNKNIDTLNLYFANEKWQVKRAIIDLSESRFLNFSFTNFNKERQLVKKYRENEIKDIENGKMGEDKVVKIGIALDDVNGDGINEIIALLSHKYYSSAQTNVALGVYLINNGKVDRYIPLPNTFVDIGNIEKQKNIGLIRRNNSNWNDFNINGKVWSWDGKGYVLAN